MVGECTTHTVRWEDESGNAGACPWCKLSSALEEAETLRMQLAACGVAALCNTRESADKQRVSRDSPYWCASYQDVCDASDREMTLLGRLDSIRDHAEQMLVNVHAPEATAEKVVEWMEKDVAELQRLCAVERHEHFWKINAEGSARCDCGAVSAVDENGRMLSGQ